MERLRLCHMNHVPGGVPKVAVLNQKTKSELNKGTKICPLIQLTFGSYHNNYPQRCKCFGQR